MPESGDRRSGVASSQEQDNVACPGHRGDDMIAERQGLSRSGLGDKVDIAKASLVVYNIVVVFRELRFTDLLRTAVRQLLPAYPNPLITEVPNQLIGVLYADQQIECQFANRRVEVRDRRGLVGATPFCEIAVAATQKAVESGSQPIVSYGFNYTMLIPLEADSRAGQYVLKYLSEPERLGEAFGGKVTDVGINATVEADCEVNFDLGGVPDASNMLKAHGNYHFKDAEPPGEADKVRVALEAKYEDFCRALNALPG